MDGDIVGNGEQAEAGIDGSSGDDSPEDDTSLHRGDLK